MKRILVILLVLISSKSFGQQQQQYFWALNQSSCSYFGVDSIPAAIYSFRNVNPCRYSGNCVKIRRSSDNTTSDIGFTSGYVDTAAIKIFVGSSDAFVDTWYNQGSRGSVIDVKQSTMAKQPKILTSGAFIYAKTGFIGIEYDGTNDLILSDSTLTSGGSSQNFSLLAVSKRTTASIFVSITINKNNNLQVNGVYNNYPTTQTSARWYGSSQIQANTGTTNLNLNLCSGYFSLSDFMASDGTTTSTTTNTVGSTFYDNIVLGGFKRSSGAEYYSPGISVEVIGYASDLRPSRTTIESNIKTYYGL